MKPASVRNSVVLPEPFGPLSNTLSPALAEKLTPFSTMRLPRAQDRFSTLSFIGCGADGVESWFINARLRPARRHRIAHL